MADVFISYASEDRSRARQFADKLTALGWSVWWDRNIPIGKTFDTVIATELTAAKCVLVLWSQASIASSWVREEVTVAQDREILVPALIDNVQIPLGHRRVQAAQLQAWRGDPDNEAFRDVVSSIAAIVGTEAAVKPAATRPRHDWPRWLAFSTSVVTTWAVFGSKVELLSFLGVHGLTVTWVACAASLVWLSFCLLARSSMRTILPLSIAGVLGYPFSEAVFQTFRNSPQLLFIGEVVYMLGVFASILMRSASRSG